MSYTIDTSINEEINFAPANEVEEVLQNIKMILITPKYSVPLERNFGTSQSYIDKPMNVAKTMLIAEIYNAIEEYEDRVEILNITFNEQSDIGKLIPIVEVSIK